MWVLEPKLKGWKTTKHGDYGKTPLCIKRGDSVCFFDPCYPDSSRHNLLTPSPGDTAINKDIQHSIPGRGAVDYCSLDRTFRDDDASSYIVGRVSSSTATTTAEKPSTIQLQVQHQQAAPWLLPLQLEPTTATTESSKLQISLQPRRTKRKFCDMGVVDAKSLFAPNPISGNRPLHCHDSRTCTEEAVTATTFVSCLMTPQLSDDHDEKQDDHDDNNNNNGLLSPPPLLRPRFSPRVSDLGLGYKSHRHHHVDLSIPELIG